MKLICALPYHSGDHTSATRLLEWIHDLDAHVDHHLLLVSDNAVPLETKKALDALGKSVFTSAETIIVRAPAAVNGNYHAPAAVMFSRAAGHIHSCLKFPFLWMEPDCVPLKSKWLNTLAFAYESQPKKFMGSTLKTNDPNLPATMFFATAIYPCNSYDELKVFCDGKKAFDVAFSDHVVDRATPSPLFWHVFGGPDDPPKFRDVKLPEDGPNVGTLDSVPQDAVLMHRCKNGSLIELLRARNFGQSNTQEPAIEPEEPEVTEQSPVSQEPEIKRVPGRPRKNTASLA